MGGWAVAQTCLAACSSQPSCAGTLLLYIACHDPVSLAGLKSNLQLLRSSLCANPGLMELVTLYGFGLGDKRATCFLNSMDDNLVRALIILLMKGDMVCVEGGYQGRGIWYELAP